MKIMGKRCRKIRVEEFALSTLICLNYLGEFFRAYFSWSVYTNVSGVLIGIYVFDHMVVKIQKQGSLILCWIISLVYIVFSNMKSGNTPSGTLDMIVLIQGVVLLLFSSTRDETYTRCMKLIVFLSLFHSIGILLQLSVPSLYAVIGHIILNTGTITADSVIKSGLHGFSSNGGCTAGYLSVGIIALISERQWSKNDKFILILLIFALLFTGKRAHVLFLAVSCFIVYVINADFRTRHRRIWKVLIALFVVIILFILLQGVLVKIPFFQETANTIDRLRLGEDITSRRSVLWNWAILQFKQNPVFGIGWAKYKTTTLGNVVYKTLDVHNIYIQLLCELGIVGSIFVLAALFISLRLTWKNYKYSLGLKKANRNTAWLALLKFSLTYQVFFLLYGLTGNPLFDAYYQIMYFFSCGIDVSFMVTFKNS